MAIPKTPGEAIAQRLLAYTALTPLVGNRITPNLPDSEPSGPYIVFQRVTGGGGVNLTGKSRLQQYFYRLDVYAATDDVAEQILTLVRNCLFGNETTAEPPWRSLSDGVQGCMPQDDISADTLEDGAQANGQTFSIWFAPQV